MSTPATTDLHPFVEHIARLTTIEDEFRDRQNEAGTVYDDGVTYASADDMLADMSDDRLMDEYQALCSLIREARLLLAPLTTPVLEREGK